MYLIVPLSGQGERFKAKGYANPKPLIEVANRPMIERLLSCFPHRWKTIFVLPENQRTTELETVLKKLRPESTVLYIQPHKKGPSFAVLTALEFVPKGSPVLVSYGDYGMIWDADQFENFVQKSDCGACVISYRGFHPHYLLPTTYAYSKIENDRVVQIKEKESFTAFRENEYASSGAYYFKSSDDLKKSIDLQISNNLSYNGEFYTSLTVQALLELKPSSFVNVFEIPYFFQWGTPEDLVIFEYWQKTFSNLQNFSNNAAQVSQILMPMAGDGSRFKSLTAVSKPLIEINHEPMYKIAIKSLPKTKKQILIIRDQSKDEIAKIENGNSTLVILGELSSGQAISTQAGLGDLDADQDVLVSACDHQIIFDPAKWNRFKKHSDIDAAIFTVKGFPGAARSPNSYSYVQIETNSANSEFPDVKNVSVKKPISAQPSKDHLLVGTFWFRNKSILSAGIESILENNKTVKGEFYLDSIFEYLGLKVKVFELDGYINWGDPESMAEALYWREALLGPSLSQRSKFSGVQL